MQVTPNVQTIDLATSNAGLGESVDVVTSWRDGFDTTKVIEPAVVAWLTGGLLRASLRVVNTDFRTYEPLTVRVYEEEIYFTDPVSGLRSWESVDEFNELIDGVTIYWGDGTNIPYSVPFAEQYVEHTYAESGEYEVRALVTFADVPNVIYPTVPQVSQIVTVLPDES